MLRRYPAGGELLLYRRWNWQIRLLLTLTPIDYMAGIWLERVPAGPTQSPVDAEPIGQPGVPRFLQVLQFPVGNLAVAMGKPPHSFFLEIVLPLGISFHTFQSMSYVVDVYRGQQRACGTVDYALFIASSLNWWRDRLSGHAISLPINGAACRLREERLRGVTDRARPHQEDGAGRPVRSGRGCVFQNVAGHPGARRLERRVRIRLQIDFDFSGYTDMAIGMAQMLGFQFPRISGGRTWPQHHGVLAPMAHVVSRWLRDYLYIPLGGNRHGTLKTTAT